MPIQAYEGLETAHKLKQEYVFLPAKLKEVYLTYLLEHLEDHKVSLPRDIDAVCKECCYMCAAHDYTNHLLGSIQGSGCIVWFHLHVICQKWCKV